jgi:GNAT superfamily N-acetyltransferase
MGGPAASNGPSMTIRPAQPQESAALSALALSSKSHWGYDRSFLEAVRDSLTFSVTDFEAGPILVLELDGELRGVYHLVGRPPEGELSDLWVDPHAIGLGLGRMLFRHALETASREGFKTLLIASDPHAKGFYLAMGAAHVGHRRSEAGRWLPLLRVAVPSGRGGSS